MRRVLGLGRSLPSAWSWPSSLALAGVSVGLAQRGLPDASDHVRRRLRARRWRRRLRPRARRRGPDRRCRRRSRSRTGREPAARPPAAYALGRPADGHTILFAHAGSTILTPTITNQPQPQVGRLRAGGADPRRGGVAVRPPRTPSGRRSTRWRPRQGEPRQVPRRRLGDRRHRQLRHPLVGEGGRTSTSSTSRSRAAGRPRWPSWARTSSCSSATSPTRGQHLEAKKMVPLAVASEKRSAIFPDVPTLKEKGWDVVMVAVARRPRARRARRPPGAHAGRRVPEGARDRLLEDLPRTHPGGRRCSWARPSSAQFLAAEEARFVPLVGRAGTPEEVEPPRAGDPDRLRRVVGPGRALFPAGAAAVPAPGSSSRARTR